MVVPCWVLRAPRALQHPSPCGHHHCVQVLDCPGRLGLGMSLKVRRDLWQLRWAPEGPWLVGNGPGIVQSFKHTHPGGQRTVIKQKDCLRIVWGFALINCCFARCVPGHRGCRSRVYVLISPLASRTGGGRAAPAAGLGGAGPGQSWGGAGSTRGLFAVGVGKEPHGTSSPRLSTGQPPRGDGRVPGSAQHPPDLGAGAP